MNVYICYSTRPIRISYWKFDFDRSISCRGKNLNFYVFFMICIKGGDFWFEIWGTSRDRILKVIAYSCSGKSKCIESTPRTSHLLTFGARGGRCPKSTSPVPPTEFQKNFGSPKFCFGLNSHHTNFHTSSTTNSRISSKKCSFSAYPHFSISTGPPPLTLQMSLKVHLIGNLM